MMLQRLLAGRTPSNCALIAYRGLNPLLCRHGPSSSQQAVRASASAAQALEQQQEPAVSSGINSSNSRLEVDSWGAVSSIPDRDPVPHLRTTSLGASDETLTKGYVNHDGMRVDDGRYKRFLEDAGESFEPDTPCSASIAPSAYPLSLPLPPFVALESYLHFNRQSLYSCQYGTSHSFLRTSHSSSVTSTPASQVPSSPATACTPTPCTCWRMAVTPPSTGCCPRLCSR